MEIYTFDQITLLITHYNRSASLERLLQSIEDLHLKFRETIVSDDGSKTEHLHYLNRLKEKYGFKLICSDKNKGLANNINKGQQAVSSPYTLYIQEDFVPARSFREHLKNGLELMEEDPLIDLVRFYAHYRHPYLKPLRNGFSEMRFQFWSPGSKQFWCYSDNPHLRRSNFLEKFGFYREGIGSDKAELQKAISFLQKKGKAIIHDDFRTIFLHENDSEEPSQVSRKKFRKFLQVTDLFLIKTARTTYRNIKFRIQYLFF